MPSLAGDLPGSIPQPLDALIIGAGIAGSAAALRLARTLGPAAHILLVERCSWPRPKVCGGCLNRAALALLRDLELPEHDLLRAAAPITHLHLHSAGRQARWPLPHTLAVARSTLDDLLVRAAIKAGVTFLPECSAQVLPTTAASASHPVLLRRGEHTHTCTARTILIADGLAGASLDALPAFRPRIHRHSWIGLGGTLAHPHPSLAPAGAISMHIGPRGYVGLVRFADHHTHLAAAIDPAFIRAHANRGGPVAALAHILGAARADVAPTALEHLALKGTPALTRRRDRVSAPGLLVLGDAASYIEPFTGEGMAWALASALFAADLAARAAHSTDPHTPARIAHEWQHRHAGPLARRQLPSRALRLFTHHPRLAGPALALINRSHAATRVAAAIARGIAAPYPITTPEAAA